MHDAAYALLKDAGFQKVYQSLHTKVDLVQYCLTPSKKLHPARAVPFGTPAAVPVPAGVTPGMLREPPDSVDPSAHPPVVKKQRRLNTKLRNMTPEEHANRAAANREKRRLREQNRRKRRQDARQGAAAGLAHAQGAGPDPDAPAGAGGTAPAGTTAGTAAPAAATAGARGGAPGIASATATTGPSATAPARAAAPAHSDASSGAVSQHSVLRPAATSQPPRRGPATQPVRLREAVEGLRQLASTNEQGDQTYSHTSTTKMLFSFRATVHPVQGLHEGLPDMVAGQEIRYDPSANMTGWLLVSYRGRIGYVPAKYTGAPAAEAARAAQQSRRSAKRSHANTSSSTPPASSVMVPERAVTVVLDGGGGSVPVARLSAASTRPVPRVSHHGMLPGAGTVEDTCSE